MQCVRHILWPARRATARQEQGVSRCTDAAKLCCLLSVTFPPVQRNLFAVMNEPLCIDVVSVPQVAQGQPQSLAIPSVAGDSCQSLSQPTPVSLPTLTLPTPQAQPEQAMPGSATGEHTAELPPNAVLVRPVRSRRPSYKLRESPASSESQSGSAAPPTAHSSRPALSPAYSDDSSGHAFVQQSAIAAQPIEVARCAASHPLKRARSSQLGLLPQPSQSHAPPHNALEAAEPAAPSDSVHTAMAHGGSVPARVAIPMASSALLFPYPAAAGASVAAAPVYGPANVAAPAPSVSFPAATAAVPGAVVLFLPVRTCKGPRRLVSTM